MPTLHSMIQENASKPGVPSAVDTHNVPVSFSRIAELQTWRMLGLVTAIALMFAVFQFATGGLFFTPRNLSNLSVQTSVTALLTVGLTWLMVARQIDLSGGALIALVGVLVAKSEVTLGMPLAVTIAGAIALGALVGAAQGFLITKLSIPAFIATLAAFSYLRGAAFITTDGMTVAGLGDNFYMIANSNLPLLMSIALILVAGIVLIGKRLLCWRKPENRGNTRPVDVASVIVLAICTIVGAWAFGSYRGIPSPVIVALLVIGIATFVANNTAFGRHIYAVGASPEAARRAGINVKGMLITLFVLSGVLAAVGSLIQTSRLDAGAPGTAEFLALDAISACVIGGTSLFGGKGTVTASALGALLMSTIANGLSLMGTNTYWQLVTTGVLLIAALTVERVTNKAEQS